jgi:hypothetical protein
MSCAKLKSVYGSMLHCYCKDNIYARVIQSGDIAGSLINLKYSIIFNGIFQTQESNKSAKKFEEMR